MDTYLAVSELWWLFPWLNTADEGNLYIFATVGAVYVNYERLVHYSLGDGADY